jgi:orotate phosphoribosyltransferase
MSDRDVLLDQVNAKAVVRGKVTLASGREADYYVDMRRVTLDAEAAPAIGRVMLDLTDDLDFEAVGGRTLDAFVIRKSQKVHGLQKLIEGPSVEGRRVLAVEDTSTTGGSVLEAVKALREAGAEVVAVAVVVDRDTGARQAVEAEGLEYRYAVGISDLDI